MEVVANSFNIYFVNVRPNLEKQTMNTAEDEDNNRDGNPNSICLHGVCEKKIIDIIH